MLNIRNNEKRVRVPAMRALLQDFLRDESGTVLEYVMIGILITMITVSLLVA